MWEYEYVLLQIQYSFGYIDYRCLGSRYYYQKLKYELLSNMKIKYLSYY